MSTYNLCEMRCTFEKMLRIMKTTSVNALIERIDTKKLFGDIYIDMVHDHACVLGHMIIHGNIIIPKQLWNYQYKYRFTLHKKISSNHRHITVHDLDSISRFEEFLCSDPAYAIPFIRRRCIQELLRRGK